MLLQRRRAPLAPEPEPEPDPAPAPPVRPLQPLRPPLPVMPRARAPPRAFRPPAAPPLAAAAPTAGPPRYRHSLPPIGSAPVLAHAGSQLAASLLPTTLDAEADHVLHHSVRQAARGDTALLDRALQLAGGEGGGGHFLERAVQLARKERARARAPAPLGATRSP